MRSRRLRGAIMALVAFAVACSAGDDSRPARREPRVPPAGEERRTAATGSADSAGAVKSPTTAGVGGGAIHPAARPAATVPAGAPAAASSARAQRASAPRRVTLGTLDLTGVGHDAGSVTAPVVLIDFSDFGCPYCGEFTRETYPAIEREYVRTGKVFFKYVPFIVGMFPHARESTRAVECVADQGLFWPMADHVYEAQRLWKGGGDPRALLMGIAGVVGADTSAVSRCYRDGRTDARTARANDIAATIGVRVTPSFIVNGRPIQGALPLADFRRVIDAALLLGNPEK